MPDEKRKGSKQASKCVLNQRDDVVLIILTYINEGIISSTTRLGRMTGAAARRKNNHRNLQLYVALFPDSLLKSMVNFQV